MKNIFPYLILISLLLNGCSSQNLEELKNQEVMFVLADTSDNSFSKQNWNKDKTDPKKDSFWYNYSFDDGSKIKLVYHEFSDFDQKEKNNAALFFKTHKRFLKDIEGDMLTTQTFHNLGPINALELLRSTKTIILLEKDILDKNQVVFREVRLFEIGEE